jgi:hypothetical protein
MAATSGSSPAAAAACSPSSRRVLAEQPPQHACLGPGHDRCDRLHDGLEEQRSFGLVTTGPQHGPAVFGGLGGEGLGQRGLPDAGFADDRHEPGLPSGGRIPCLPQQPDLAVAPGQRCPASQVPVARGRAPALVRSAIPPAVLLAQDGQVQLSRLRRRVGAELTPEPLAERLIAGERLRLLAGRCRSRHVPAVCRLVERVSGDGRLRVARRQPRIPGRQRRLGRHQPHPAQQLSYLLPGWIRPVRIGLVADRGTRDQ